MEYRGHNLFGFHLSTKQYAPVELTYPRNCITKLGLIRVVNDIYVILL